MYNAVLLVLLCSLSALSPLSAADTSIYLVRHAEKIADGSRDPALTSLGEDRSRTIAKLFQAKTVSHIFSTATIRTMETAAPTAQQHRLEIEVYDPAAPQALVERLKTLEGTILVVGHSNTTPQLVNLLTGSQLDDLDDRVYDRVYIVTIDDHGVGHLEIETTEPRTPLD